MKRKILALLLGLNVTPAWSASVTVTPDTGCGGKVYLLAERAKLSEVMRKLAETLGFTLEFKSLEDPLIEVNTQRPAAELIHSLTRSHNLVVMEEPDARCGGQARIVKVALLPKGPETAPRPLPPPPPRVMTPEELLGLEMYRKAHGLDENGNPKPPPPRQ